MTAPTAVPATAPPTGAPPGSGAPPGGSGDFAATLTDIASARTATAEGHQEAGNDTPASPDRHDADDATPSLTAEIVAVVAAPIVPAAPAAACGQAPKDEGAHAAPSPAVPGAATLVDLVGPALTSSTHVAEAAASNGDAAATGDATGAGQATATAEAAATPAAPAPAGEVPALALASPPSVPGRDTKQANELPASTTHPAPDAPAAAPDRSPLVPGHDVKPAGEAPGPEPKQAADVAATTPAPAPAAHQAHDATTPTPQPAQAKPDAVTSPASAPPRTPEPARPDASAPHALRLPIAPDHARALLRIATHRGQARAQLTLRPAELGGVDVRLRITTRGLVASITAERPESAQILQQAGADLRRALEAQGVEVAALDISLAGDGAGGRAHERGADAAPAARPDRSPADDDLQPTDPNHPTTSTPTIALGALVDVLA